MIHLTTAAEIFRRHDYDFRVHSKQFVMSISFARPDLEQPYGMKLVNELYAAGARFTYPNPTNIMFAIEGIA